MSNGGNVDDEFFRYSLIEAVRVRPQLWMKSATKIRGSRRQLTSKLWAEVGSITNRPGAECRKIFKNLIDVKRSNDKKLKNGFLAETKPKWKYYEVLNFLNVKGSRLHKRLNMSVEEPKKDQIANLNSGLEDESEEMEQNASSNIAEFGKTQIKRNLKRHIGDFGSVQTPNFELQTLPSGNTFLLLIGEKMNAMEPFWRENFELEVLRLANEGVRNSRQFRQQSHSILENLGIEKEEEEEEEEENSNFYI